MNTAASSEMKNKKQVLAWEMRGAQLSNKSKLTCDLFAERGAS